MSKDYIRELAKSDYWQTLYIRSKEIGTLQLFTNCTELTDLQVQFLAWLEIYSSLNTDIAMKEPYINDEVIDSDIRTDAYLWYRRKIKGQKKDTKKRQMDSKSKLPTVMFNKR